MNEAKFRANLFILGVAILIIGCQADPCSETVVEYRPRIGQLNETPAPCSDVYLLWRWVPQNPRPNDPHPRVARQIPSEVGQSYASQGTSLGFRREKSKLIAFAGATSRPLAEAHYSWQTLPGPRIAQPVPSDSDTADNAISDVISIGLEIFIDGCTDDDDTQGDENHRQRKEHGGEHHDDSHKPPREDHHHKPASQP